MCGLLSHINLKSHSLYRSREVHMYLTTTPSLPFGTVSKRCSKVGLTRPLVASPAVRDVSVRAEETPEKLEGKTVQKVSDPMSPEFKERLRKEYIGLGGSPNQPMAQNYFLWIILIVGFLAILSYVTGSI